MSRNIVSDAWRLRGRTPKSLKISLTKWSKIAVGRSLSTFSDYLKIILHYKIFYREHYLIFPSESCIMKPCEHNPVYVNFSFLALRDTEVNLIKALSFTDKESSGGLNGPHKSITK